MRVFICMCYLWMGLFIWCERVNAQIVLTGKIADAEGGQPLATANIRAKDTFFATISNEEGAFLLSVTELPVTLIITHIGYAGQEIRVNVLDPLSIRMQSIAYPFEEIIVTPDLGSTIMQKVIAKKRHRNANLKRFKAMTYTRQTIENIENEARIVGVVDIVSEINWDGARGFREVILSKRHTKNINLSEWLRTFTVSKYLESLPNIYDDEITVGRIRIIGPTHLDAFHFYHFEVGEIQYNGKQTIYEISIRPKTKVQPTVTGRLFILDEAFVILRAELNPSPNAFLLSPFFDIQASLLQQFQEFGDDVWLPIDLHLYIEGNISVLGLVSIPKVKVANILQFKNFTVNKQLSSHLYEKDRIVSVDSASVRADSLFMKFPDSMPLSDEEAKAYREIDETLTFRKAFPPSGRLASQVKINSSIMEASPTNPSQKANPSQRAKGYRKAFNWRLRGDYNRVSMAKGSMHLGSKMINQSLGRRHGLFLEGGYAQGLSRYLYGIEFWHKWDRTRSKDQGQLSISHRNDIAKRYHSYYYDLRQVGAIGYVNPMLSLLGWDDYYDYYWRKSTDFVFSQTFFNRKAELTVGLHDAKHSSLSKQTDFNILGRNISQRINPPIDEGRLRSVDFRFDFAKSRYKRAWIRAEWSPRALFKSDFSYAKYELGFDWRIETFLKRRARPNILDVCVTAGTFTGNLPVQRFGVLDVWRPFTWLGTFKYLSGYPYEGEKYVGVYWQHNFRSAPFEIFNMAYMGKRGFEIIVYGGSGRTWISEEKVSTLKYTPHVLDKFYHEAGISLNIYHLLRIDATKRLDEGGFSIRASFARLN